MANASFNPAQDVQFTASQFGQQRLSERDKMLIEALLVDSGALDFAAVANPTTPGPLPAPSPTPTPAPAPTPTPSPGQTQTPGPTVNLFLQLALNKIRPGDLITAQFGNDLVDAVLALDARLRALEGVGKATPAPATPAPSPSPSPSPTPSSSAELSLGGGRSETSGRAQPTIDSVTATTVRGKGVTIAVAGDNLGESQVERVLLGATQIAPSSLKFVRGGGGFSFLTTTAVVDKSRNRLTVVTSGGEDSAALGSGTRKGPVA